ncbi:hypothetical protein JCM5353_001141 [Sporobolomyces roseus]
MGVHNGWEIYGGHIKVSSDLRPLAVHCDTLLGPGALRTWHIVIDMGRIVYLVYRSIWIRRYRRLAPADFNDLFSFLVIYRLDQHLSYLARAFNLTTIYFTCLWDSSRYRPDSKRRTSSERDIAAAQQENEEILKERQIFEAKQKAREMEQRRYLARKKRKEALQNGTSSNLPAPLEDSVLISKAASRAEEVARSRKVTLVTLDQVVFPTAPDSISYDDRFSHDLQFVGFRREHVCHQVSHSEADALFASANSVPNPTSGTVPFLERIVLHPNAQHATFIQPLDQSALNTADSDFSFLLDPAALSIRFVVTEVSLGLKKRKEMTITSTGDDFTPRPPAHDPRNIELPVWRILDWKTASLDRSICRFTTRAGRIVWAAFLGFDYLIGGWPNVGWRTLLSLDASFYNFFDSQTFIPFIQLTPQDQQLWEEGFLRQIAKLRNKAPPPVSPREFYNICSYAHGHGDPLNKFDKAVLHRELVQAHLHQPSTSGDSPALQEHRRLTELAYGLEASQHPRNHPVIPLHHLAKGPSSTPPRPPNNKGKTHHFSRRPSRNAFHPVPSTSPAH